MNPAEVRGLASMSPTGELSINPVTGQPEAFLPFLAPIIGSALGTSLLGGTALGMAGAGALGAGLATWAESGDFEKGLISGVTGFGLGQIMKGATDTIPQVDTALQGVDAAQQRVTEAMQGVAYSPELAQAGEYLQGVNPMANAEVMGASMAGPPSAGAPISAGQQAYLDASQNLSTAQSGLDAARAATTTGQRAGAMFSGEGLKGMVGALKDPAAVIPLGLGAATQANVAQQEYMEDLRKKQLGEQTAKNRRFEGILHGAREMASRTRGTNPYKNPFAAEGGRVGYQEGGHVGQEGSWPYPSWDYVPYETADGTLVDATGGILEGDTDMLTAGGPPGMVVLGTDQSAVNPLITPGQISGYTANSGVANGGGTYRDDPWADPQQGILETGVDDEGNYFIKTLAGSGAEQQSFLRGGFEQQPPPDYRHGFEKEFDFFEHEEEPELDRGYDLFGAGASDYLAGMYGLNEEQLASFYDQIQGLSPEDRTLASFDDILSQFSGVRGGISNVDAEIEETTTGDTIITEGDPADTTTIFSGDDPDIVDDTLTSTAGVNLLTQLQSISPNVDGDYTQEEADAIVSLIAGGADRQQIADYYGMTLDELMDYYNTLTAVDDDTGVVRDDTVVETWNEYTNPATGSRWTTRELMDAVLNGSMTLREASRHPSLAADEQLPWTDEERSLIPAQAWTFEDFEWDTYQDLRAGITAGTITPMEAYRLTGRYEFVSDPTSFTGGVSGDDTTVVDATTGDGQLPDEELPEEEPPEEEPPEEEPPEEDPTCPSPDTLIKLKDGETTAGELKVGDLVHTQHEDTLEWGDWPVTHAEIVENQPRLKLIFCDDNNEESEIVCSWSHKFNVDGKEWVEAEDMQVGDVVSGIPLRSVELAEDGDVVKITVDEAHTYVAGGLLSHNKSLDELGSALWNITNPSDIDGDYSQEEVDAVVGLIDAGHNKKRIADYYGMTVDELMGYYNTIKAGDTTTVVDDGTTGTPPWEIDYAPLWMELEGVTPPDQIDGDYSQAEIDGIVSLIDAGNELRGEYASNEEYISAIADYYNMTVDELMGHYNTITGSGTVVDDTATANPLLTQLQGISPDVDGDYSQTEVDSIVSLIDSGADTQQIADYYGMTLNELMDYYNTIKAGPADTAVVADTATDTVVDTVEDTAAAATTDRSALIQDYVKQTFGDPPYTQDQALDFARVALDNNVSAEEVADALNVPLDVVTDLYGQVFASSDVATIPEVSEGEIQDVIGATTDFSGIPSAELWAGSGSYSGDMAGAEEAASATVEYQNQQEMEESIRNYVADTYGEPPYTQQQAMDFAGDALEAGLPAETVAAALDVPVDTVVALYDAQGVYGGGRVGKRQFMTSSGPVELANGGIADLPVSPEIMQPMEEVIQEEVIVEEEPYVDFPQLIEMTVEAIKGNIEDSDAIINQFIEEYGIEKFQMLRDAVLKSVAGNPEAQTEGVIEGTGGGMDDEVIGVIGEQQDIAVSPGEYIVAADVLSGLGDGDTNAGADVMDQVAANVRAARSGGRQPAPIDLSKVMPA
jgi:hypothetical protein